MLDLEKMLDGIAKARRSPILDELALARAARASIFITKAVKEFPADLRDRAEALAEKLWIKAAADIAASRYQDAYELLDEAAAAIARVAREGAP